MPRTALPYHAADISALARHLQRQWRSDHPQTATAWNHSRWLQALATAAGARNYQAWRAAAVNPPDDGAATAPTGPLHAAPAATPTATVYRPTRDADALVLPRPAIDNGRWRSAADVPPRANDPVRNAIDRTPLPSALRLRVLRTASQFDGRGRLLRWPSQRAVADLAMWALWMRFDAQAHYTEAEVTAMLATLNAFGDPVTLRRELVNARLLARERDGSRYWRVTPEAPPEARALMDAVQVKMGLMD